MVETTSVRSSARMTPREIASARNTPREIQKPIQRKTGINFLRGLKNSRGLKIKNCRIQESVRPKASDEVDSPIALTTQPDTDSDEHSIEKTVPNMLKVEVFSLILSYYNYSEEAHSLLWELNRKARSFNNNIAFLSLRTFPVFPHMSKRELIVSSSDSQETEIETFQWPSDE